MVSNLPFEVESSEPLPGVVMGYVSVRSQGQLLRRKTVPDSTSRYRGKPKDLQHARRALEDSGFELVAESRLGVAVAGAPAAYQELTGAALVTRERLMHTSAGQQRYVTHLDLVGEDQPLDVGVGRAAATSDLFDAVFVERPQALHGVFPAPLPPLTDRFHLRVPDDVAVGLNAVAAHRAGVTGDGVRVAMVDTGQYAHTFFVAHRYQVQPATAVVPGTSPTVDPVGHGTGESANIFAVAPGAVLEPYRASDAQGNLVGAIGGLLLAKDSIPAVLTNSWGGDGPFPPLGPPDSFEIAVAMELLDAIEQGIVVVFSAGNGHFSIEPQVPGVLAAGGTFATADLDLEASDYTSGYASPFFNVTVPDVCGLVGMRPRAQYLMLPVPPGGEIDVAESQTAPPFDPDDDGTGPNDGWALFSGSSAAAPQAAGAAALLLEARPALTPGQVNQALKLTAVDVRVGRCHPRFNNPAQVGPDEATGFGLIDAAAAVRFAVDNF